MYDFLQMMYQDGRLSSTELAALKKTCQDLKENPVRLLRSLNIASQPEIQDLLQRFYRCDAATDELIEALDVSAAEWIPMDLALHCSVVGLGLEEGKLLVLMEDPSDKSTLHKLEFFLAHRVKPIVATSMQLARAICRVYEVGVQETQLTTSIEASRGVVGGLEYDPSQSTRVQEEYDLFVDAGQQQLALRELVAGGVYEKLRAIELSPPFVLPKKKSVIKKRDAVSKNALGTADPATLAANGFGSEQGANELALKLSAPLPLSPQKVSALASQALLKLTLQGLAVAPGIDKKVSSAKLPLVLKHCNAILAPLGLVFSMAGVSKTRLVCLREGSPAFEVDLELALSQSSAEKEFNIKLSEEYKGLVPLLKQVAKYL